MVHAKNPRTVILEKVIFSSQCKIIDNYRTRAIITRGLYIFTPFFSAVYNQEQLILQTIYVQNKESWA